MMNAILVIQFADNSLNVPDTLKEFTIGNFRDDAHIVDVVRELADKNGWNENLHVQVISLVNGIENFVLNVPYARAINGCVDCLETEKFNPEIDEHGELDVNEFSKSPCEVCGSTLAGQRFAGYVNY